MLSQPQSPTSLALLTDLYELTMAYAYWKSGHEHQESVFHLYFRRSPFGGGYAIACGLEPAIRFLESFRFESAHLAYLASLKGNDERPLFEEGFLKYLEALRLHCDIDAVEEGTVVFPQEPLMRVQGPIIHAQLLESALLNYLNFQSLIATKAARVVISAKGDPVIEFGLRRAQGIDGALSATRAAYVGGCESTSNTLAGHLYGIPVRGTHAHSWVMSFRTQREAFEAYARALPNNTTLLVDTYNTIEGIREAIDVGRDLRARGHRLAGVRMDSGDLAYLSIVARQMLDAAGMKEVAIMASNDLDEYIIGSLKEQGAKINVWGVGTRLCTAYDQPALGMVYKISAVRSPGETKWEHRVKLSEQAVKVSTPGVQQIRRFRSGNEYVADVIYSLDSIPSSDWNVIDPLDMTRQKTMSLSTQWEDLLVPIYRQGKLIYTPPSLQTSRLRVREQLKGFHAGVKRFVNPHQYPVGLEENLFRLKTDLILRARGMKAKKPVQV